MNLLLSIFDRLSQHRTAALIAAVSTLGIANTHAEGPAVHQLNAKLEINGGSLDGDGTGIAAGSIAAPLGHSFGAQLDVIAGSTDGDGLAGYGLHAFWRDPQQGLLGVVSSRTGRGGNFVNRYGVEGEFYSDQWTLAAGGGTQTGFVGNTGYANLMAKYYLNDDLLLELSGQGFSDTRVGQIGLEWQPVMEVKGLTVFAVGGFGSDDLDYALAGVRWYFGGSDKSLKLRHREDDPVNSLIGAATVLNNAITLEEIRRRDLAASAQAAGAGSSGGSLGGSGPV